jgi:hypothetical protein
MSGCPWSGFEPATMEFCERPLCSFLGGWVTQPANTVSNLAYFVVGAIVMRRAFADGRRHLAPFGAIAIAVGLGSTFFHASSTFVGEVVDIGAMFLFSAFWLTLDLHRLTRVRPAVQLAFFVAVVFGSMGALLAWKTVGIALFAVQIAATFAIEIALRVRGLRGVDYRDLRRTCVAFGVAYAIWRLDFHRVLICDRDAHVLQGHAAWHVINALCFWFLYRYFWQFPSNVRRASPA